MTNTNTKKLEGLGGWLIVVAIGLFVTFFLVGRQIYDLLDMMFFSGTLEEFININSDYYIPYIDKLFLFELIGNTLLINVNIYLTYLFFKKDYKFVNTFIFLEIFNIIIIVFDQILYQKLLAQFFGSSDLKDLFRALIHAGIWIPYMLKSERVKNTFINGRPTDANYDSISR
ncbi:DUF2569 domain-containing protein [Gilliamella sp. G0441]|uniref:DUF2569 domain-containing protein n=1 Tax=Gilliamella sp. G0441 TaxID=3384760 RepID=UPI003D330BA0